MVDTIVIDPPESPPPSQQAATNRRKRSFGLALGILLAGLFLSSIFYLANTGIAQNTEQRSQAASSGATQPATLSDYWNGNAEWQFEHAIMGTNSQWVYGMASGSHVEVVGSTWYLFSREFTTDLCYPTSPEASLHTIPKSGIVVRKSTDKGKTWTDKTWILRPDANTPWSCTGTDGDAYYESATQTWHYLFQCLSTENTIWNACYVQKTGSDPTNGVAFTATIANPIFPTGSLWQRICDSKADDCVRLTTPSSPVYGEGTFTFLSHEEGYFNILFHGYDGVKGYVGLGKTADFRTWIVGDASQNTPKDSILDSLDAANWRESWQGGSVGFGATRGLKEAGHYYAIAESMDKNLACAEGQNWDWGIFRSQTLGTTTWEQPPWLNPFLYSNKNTEPNGKLSQCNPAYAGLIKDADGTTYLHYSRDSLAPERTGLLFFKLVPKTNILTNGNFWTCSIEGWQRRQAAKSELHWQVSRNTNESPDDNCHLLTNCSGVGCGDTSYIYQEVPKPSSVSIVQFGGAFAGTPSDTIVVVLEELDAQKNVLEKHTLTVSNLTTVFQKKLSVASLQGTTKHLRLKFSATKPGTVKIDTLIIEPTTTIATPTSQPTAAASNLQGDFNNDGAINDADYAILNDDYKNNRHDRADMNNDQKVDLRDYVLFINLWGSNASTTTPALTTPTPTSSAGRQKCASYIGVNGTTQTFCATCGNGFCETKEQCSSSTPNSMDCGPLYCPRDCTKE